MTDKAWWKRRTNAIAGFQTLGIIVPTFMATNSSLIGDHAALMVSGVLTGVSAVGLVIIRNLWKDDASGTE